MSDNPVRPGALSERRRCVSGSAASSQSRSWPRPHTAWWDSDAPGPKYRAGSPAAQLRTLAPLWPGPDPRPVLCFCGPWDSRCSATSSHRAPGSGAVPGSDHLGGGSAVGTADLQSLNPEQSRRLGPRPHSRPGCGHLSECLSRGVRAWCPSPVSGHLDQVRLGGGGGRFSCHQLCAGGVQPERARATHEHILLFLLLVTTACHSCLQNPDRVTLSHVHWEEGRVAWKPVRISVSLATKPSMGTAGSLLSEEQTGSCTPQGLAQTPGILLFGHLASAPSCPAQVLLTCTIFSFSFFLFRAAPVAY